MRSKTRSRREFKIKRLSNEDSAVSNVVSSIMMLGIVMTIIGMILTIYVPMWARSNEISHLEDVNDSLIDLKITIDSQILSDNVGSKFSTHISLGASGGPMLKLGRTTGGLDFDSGRATIMVYQTDDAMNIFGEGGGNLVFTSNNNYYLDQDMVYENGAVLVMQGEDAIMRFTPSIFVNKDTLTNITSLDLTVISLVGNHKNVGGSADRSIDTVLTSDMDSPHEFDWTGSGTGSSKNITIKFNTFYPAVWEKYFNETFSEGANPLTYDTDGSGTANNGDFYIELMDYSGSDPVLSDSTDIFIHIRNVGKLDCEHAVLALTIK